ncbi:MAG: hypothetical protein Q9225_006874 [Loekoesia sp. 1 TL-2023]
MAAQEALRTDKDDDDDDVSWEDVPTAPISDPPQPDTTTDDAPNPSDIDAENDDFYGCEDPQDPPPSPHPASSQPIPPPATPPPGVEVAGRGKKRIRDMGDGVEGPASSSEQPQTTSSALSASGTSTSDESSGAASAQPNAMPQQSGVEDDDDDLIPTPEQERADMLRSGWDPDEDYTPMNRDDATGEDRTGDAGNGDSGGEDVDESGLTDEDRQRFAQQRRGTRDLHLQYLEAGGECPDDCVVCRELKREGRI